MSLSFELTVLGTGSATPTLKRNPSAQVLNVKDRLYLIDCGEGTQVALRKNKIKFQRIEHIFISHLHGDHYLGLQGLISTFGLLGREKALHIYSPPGLEELCKLHFKLSGTQLNYPLHFHQINTNEKTSIFENNQLSVDAFPLKHRIPTIGFRFQEKEKLRHINGPLAKELNVPHYAFNQLKQGKDYSKNDEYYSFEKFTLPADPSYSYAYCSDTAYMPSVVDHIKEVDLLYHETTFMHKDLALAKKTFHSTCQQAAQIAKMANVKLLLMGHYSSRYDQPEKMLEECKKTFENSHLCQDGDVIDPRKVDI